MARSTLSELIARLRGLTDAGTADYTLGTATYWDDDQLALALDRQRADFHRERLTPIPDHAGGSIQYFEYRSRYGNLEQTDEGTAIFVVEDATGADKGTADYSVDYVNGIITFGSDQRGSAFYLTARRYDLNGAAADVWRHKAANSAKLYDFRTDNHDLKRSQLMAMCLQMAAHYARLAEPLRVTVHRSDDSDL